MRLERYYSDLLMPFGMLDKPPILESKEHLEWVRERKCVATGTDIAIDAHHVIKRSQGTNDYTAIPLNHNVHMRGHTVGWEQLEYEYGIDIKDALIATLCERIWLLEETLRRWKT